MFPYIPLGYGYFIPTYIFVISLTFSACVLWVYFRALNQKRSVSTALDFCLMIMIGGFLGGRLFHILYENWNYYLLFPADVFKVWQGGFVFYGGFFGALLFSVSYALVRKENFWAWADFFAPVLALGYTAGRLGCFLNGCCFGELCDFPWAIEFHQPGLPTGPRHPTQLYALFWELLVSFPLVLRFGPLLAKKLRLVGAAFALWLVLHSVGRLLMELFRDDHRGPEPLGLSVSSWISLLLLTTGATFLALAAYRRR